MALPARLGEAELQHRLRMLNDGLSSPWKLLGGKLVYDSHELHIDWYQARQYSAERIRFLQNILTIAF